MPLSVWEKDAIKVILPALLSIILLIIAIFGLILPELKTSLMDKKKEMVREVLQPPLDILDFYYQKEAEGELSRQEAQAVAVSQIKKMRYGPEGKDYFWINDMHPRMIMHPYRPDLDNTDLSNYQDPNGKRLFVAFVEVVKKDGRGYVPYMWQWKDDPTRIVPKISYVKEYKPWGWIIGTGVYIEDVRKEISEATKNLVYIAVGILVLQLILSSYLVRQGLKATRKRLDAEREIIEQYQLQQSLLDAAGLPFYYKDIEGRYLGCNQAFCAWVGKSRKEIIGKTALDIFPPDQAEIHKKQDNALLTDENHPGIVYEMQVKNTDGAQRTVILHKSIFRDLQGNIAGVIGASTDISDIKKTQEALRQSEKEYRNLYEDAKRAEELYRSLINSSADAIVIYDMEGNVQYLSPSFTDIFGWTEEELRGGKVPFVPDSEKDVTWQEISRVIYEGIPRQGFETKRYTKAGKMLDISISASRYDDHEGAPAGMLVILRDVSRTKTLEAQLLHAQKMEAVGTLAGGIAHDFNNLLQAIQGYAQLILLEKKAGDADYKNLQEIDKAGARAANLTRQLLTFSRKVESNLKPVNLNHEIMQIDMLLKRTLPKMVEVRLNLSEKLNTINADPIQIEQVLMNLAVNARDAVSGGGFILIETENVTLGEEYSKTHLGLMPGEYVLLTFTDNGQGMDKDTLDHIFDPFFSTKETGKGTGLGLSMVYGIVKNHYGEILCYSEPGKGTSFKIFFPTIETECFEERDQEAFALEQGNETILIVDDEDWIRDLVGKMLLKCGYKIIEADSGEKALETYNSKQEKIDLIILDLGMPGMGGHNCLIKLKSLNPDVKVIIASGYAIGEQVQESLEAGADGFIGKPYKMAHLTQKVRQVLDLG